MSEGVIFIYTAIERGARIVNAVSTLQNKIKKENVAKK